MAPKKEIRTFYRIADFEAFVNSSDVDIISIDIRAMDQSATFQESFFAIAYYTVASPPSEASEQKDVQFDLPHACVYQLQQIALADDEMVKREGAAEKYRFIARHILELFEVSRPSVVTQSEKGETAEEVKKHVDETFEGLNSLTDDSEIVWWYKELIVQTVLHFTLQERSRAIDDCLEALKVAGMSDRDYNGKVVLETLEKLKSRQ